MAHVMVGESAWKPILGTIEDGGEMFAASVITWYTFRLGPTTANRPNQPTPK